MIRLYPYSLVNGVWSIPDDELWIIYDGLVNDGVIKEMFYDEPDPTFEGFMSIMKSPANLPIFAFIDNKPAGVAWLNGLAATWAVMHFGINKIAWGKESIKIAQYFISYWFSLKKDGEPIFKTLVGVTPNDHKKAIKFIERLGLTIATAIPGVCPGSNDEIGVISYIERPKDGQQTT